MSISDSWLFSDGDINYIQNLNIIRDSIFTLEGTLSTLPPNAVSMTQLDDLIYIRAQVIPDGGVSDQTAVLQSALNSAPVGSTVTLPSQGVVRFGNITIPTGVSLRSNGCKPYKAKFKFKPSTAQEFNTVLRDIWFKQCTFDISATGASGVSTAVSTSLTITDNTKNYTEDQYIGYYVKVAGQNKKIVSNSATTLTIAGSSPFSPSIASGTAFTIAGYVNAIVYDHCFIDGTDLNDAGKTIGTTTNASAMVNAITIGEHGFDVQLVNGTRICNYQGWGVDVFGNTTPDNSGTPLLATGVFVTMSDTKIFNCGGQGTAGVVTSVTATTLRDTAKNWPTNYYAGWLVRILTGAGSTQLRIVKSNTNNELTLHDNAPWVTNPAIGGTFDFYCGGGLRFVGGPQDGGSVHLTNVLFDHCQQAWNLDDSVGGVPTTPNTSSGGITLLANNLRIETCGNINEQYWNGSTGFRSAPAIFNNRGNVTINGLWYASSVTETDYRNVWNRYGQFSVKGGKFVNKPATYSVFCDAGVSAIWDIPTSFSYAIGAIRPVLVAESGSNTGQEMVLRLRISKNKGATGTSSTTGTTTTLTDSTKFWATDIFQGATMRITAGTGNGATVYTILSNTSNTLTITGTFVTTPDNTSVYLINPGLRAQNMNTYGAGFGLGNNPTGEAFVSSQSDVFANNDVSTVATTNAFNAIYYRLNTTGEIVTVTFAFRFLRCVMNASIVSQNAGLVNVIPDIVMKNSTSNFSLIFKDNTGANVNLLTALADGDNGIATSSTTTTLVDTTKTWTVDAFKNSTLRIVAGTGVVVGTLPSQADDLYTITGNTSNTITIAGTWQTNPDTTSVYVITGKQVDVMCRIGLST